MAEMIQLREIAESYYSASSTEVKAKADKFFDAMDDDGDKKVGLEEFLTFMKHHGYPHIRKSSFFKVFEETGHGALSFMDVMTLYYVIKSGRPFCDCCDNFVPGVFFSCVHCFNDNLKPAFDICHHCFKSDKFKHSHSGAAPLFLDNYALLQATRHSYESPPPPTTTSTAIVEKPQSELSSGTGQSYSSGADVLPISPSDDFASAFIKNAYNRSVEQPRSDSGPLEWSASKNVATPSNPVTNYASTPSTAIVLAPSTAIVLATKPPGMWTELASASFKALDKLIAIGNLAGLIASAIGCTIM